MGRVFAGVLLIYLALLPPGMFAPDANSMFEVARSLVTDLDFSIACEDTAARGRGGECFSPWYPLLSIIGAPFAGVGLVVAAILDLPGTYLAKVTALVLPAACGAGAAALCAGIALRLGAGTRAAVGAAVALSVGTEALTYSRTFYAESLSAFLVAAGVLWLAGPGRRRVGSASAFGLAVLAKPTMVAVAAGGGVAAALSGRRLRWALAPLGGAAVGGVLYLAYNWLRFGRPLDFGGPRPGQGDPEDRSLEVDSFGPLDVVEGIGILLVSPGRGLLWFSPVALLGAWMLWRRRSNPIAAACLGGTAGLVLLHSGFPGSGFEWATRYLVAVLPLLCVGIALLGRRLGRLAVVLALYGLLVQLPVIVAFPERWLEEAEARGVDNGEVYWAFPPKRLIESWPAAGRQLEAAAASDPRELVQSAGGGGDRGIVPVEEQQLLRVVALWWWMLPAAGVAAWPGAALSVGAIAAGALLLWRAAGLAGGRRGPPAAPRDGPAVSATAGAQPHPPEPER